MHISAYLHKRKHRNDKLENNGVEYIQRMEREQNIEGGAEGTWEEVTPL